MRNWRDFAALALAVLGFFSIVGHCLGLKPLKGIGALTVASPLPIVFTEVKGVETFASDFFVEYETVSGGKQMQKISPQTYAYLGGPYNWRNVYGAAISYGPILPKEVWQPILQHGFREGGDLRRLLGVNEPILNPVIRVRTRTAGRNDEWLLNLGGIQ